ncbi:hypothetical protein C8R46DRAFT_1188771 [Mycena filopes]|nr:hypothetical protein C8R46DRAFT_1188771 [Mycena filopes]
MPIDAPAPKSSSCASAPPDDTATTTTAVACLTITITFLREFAITVLLAFLCLLALLHTIQYHVRLFVASERSLASTSCPPQSSQSADPEDGSSAVSLHLASLSPLAVLKITTVCALLVFLAMELAARALRRPAWSPLSPLDSDNGNARSSADLEAGVGGSGSGIGPVDAKAL